LERFTECFSSLIDPRKNQAKHDLAEMMFIALLATLCGATSCCDIALFGQAKEALLRTILVLEHGIPSHDTFSRVFRILDPKSFETVFRRFTKEFAIAAGIKGVVALDGKALRRAYETGKSHMPPVMVTAWSAKTRLALANALAPGNNEVAGACNSSNFFS
jgi:DDE_Tnp_1-associated